MFEPKPLLQALSEALLELSNSERTSHRAILAKLRSQWSGVTLRALADSDGLELIAEAPLQFTVSVSLTPADTTPWVLRGAQRWRDGDLVRVDHAVLRVSAALLALEPFWERPHLLQRLLDTCTIQALLQEIDLEFTTEEVQLAVDQFRVERGLNTPQATQAWMAELGLSIEGLERRALDAALPQKLRDALVTSAAVTSHFNAETSNYDRVTYLALEGPDRPESRAFIDAGAVLWRAQPTQHPFVKTIWRKDADDALRDFLFGHVSLGVTMTAETPEGPVLIHVLSRQAATLDSETTALIRDELFRQALAARRQRAVVEWNWGSDERQR